MSRVVRKERRLLSPEEYVARQVLSYPTLFAFKNKDTAKYAVLDQLFNVIGNGVNSALDLKRELYALVETKTDLQRVQRYHAEPVLTGYKAITKIAGMSFPDSSSSVEHVLEDEKHLYPEVVEWLDMKPLAEKSGLIVPYPNFKEDYSLVFNTNLKEITSKEWIGAAIWYYEKSLWFFNSEFSSQYSYAYPKEDSHESDYELSEMKERLETQYKDNFEAVAKDYLTPFDGDVDKFLRIRWKQEKNRVTLFIEKTLEKLRSS